MFRMKICSMDRERMERIVQRARDRIKAEEKKAIAKSKNANLLPGGQNV